MGQLIQEFRDKCDDELEPVTVNWYELLSVRNDCQHRRVPTLVTQGRPTVSPLTATLRPFERLSVA
jgi:hypothetical protein